MVERARAKRAWEKTLPHFNDVTHLQQRMRMMEEQEAREWAWREGEIQKTQDARLEVRIAISMLRYNGVDCSIASRSSRICSYNANLICLL